MHPGLRLQFGEAAKHVAPALALLAAEPHADGESLNSARLLSRLGHPVSVTALAVVPGADGREPLVLSADAHGRLKLWAPRLALPTPALSLVGGHLLHAGAINCLALHLSTEMLATAGDDGDLRVWRLPDLARCAARRHLDAQRGCLAAHGGAVTACCFTSCGNFLSSCSADGTVRLWHAVGAGEPLATICLLASSVEFAPGDDAALLVAAAAAGQGPQLLDLRQVPACTRYCAALADSQRHTDSSSGGGSGRGAPPAPLPTAAAAGGGMHPAAAMWLAGSPVHTQRVGAGAQLPVSGAAIAPACTPCPRQQPQDTAAATAAAPTPASAGTGSVQRPSSPRRQAGSLVAFSRKRCRQQQQQQQADEQAAATASRGGVSEEASPCTWLPASDSALRPPTARAAAAGGGGPFGGWSAPLSPASLLPAAWEAEDSGAVPEGAVLARYEAPPARSSAGGGEWDARQRCFVYRQGGHSLPVRWLLPLPAGLHMLTVAIECEAKLWAASGSSGMDSSEAASSGSHLCCTLLPAAADRQDGPLACRPAVSACGRYVVGGGPSGSLACWDLWLLQRQAHLPLSQRDSNASVAAPGAHAVAVTAVAIGAADRMLVSGDAGGRLVLRWL